MIDTFQLPAEYKMTEPIHAQYSFDEKISKTTTVETNHSIFRSNNRAYNEESSSDGFTYNTANQEDLSPALMYDLVYTKSDDFKGESEYATDVIRTQLQQTIRENERITLEKQIEIERVALEKQNEIERITLENTMLRSENVRLVEKLEMQSKVQTQAQSRIITIAQEIQRTPVNTSRRYTSST